MMTTVGKHRWGAGQSSSNAFVRDLGRMINRDKGSRSLEETPSVSGSSKAVGPEDSWIARSYLSRVVDVEGLERYRRQYQIPKDVVLRIPESDEVACLSKYGDVAFSEADFNTGVRFPLQPLMRELLNRLNLSPGQLAPNAWRMVVGCMVMWKVLSDGKDDLTIDELLFCYKPCQIPASPGFWSLNMRQRGLKLVVGTPSSNKEWKDDFVFVCGDNWEGLLCEKDNNFIHVRREWGVPSSSALKRPKLNSDSHNRVLRALHHNEHHFKHFIRPELLALYSFGPEPSEAVLSLQEINQKRMATAKLNKEKQKKMMSQQDEARLWGRRGKLIHRPRRAVERVLTLPMDASLASRGAKSVVTKDDIGEYDKVNTDVIKVAGVHSLMKADMMRKEEDLRKALDCVKRADEQMKMSTSQLEATRVLVVEEFKSSEAYDDNNTKYFLSGFSFLKKQAKEKYPELDFDAFQPFEDDESMMPVDDRNVGTTSADPQMDDDATS
uniref:Uncharacterized protein n=1 Tax=Fagus sylvatica TaxID=28930 RepID=A0A2N9GAD2_FAGSY